MGIRGEVREMRGAWYPGITAEDILLRVSINRAILTQIWKAL